MVDGNIGLNGVWRFQPDPYEEGEALGWFADDCDSRLWRETAVPSTFDRSLPLLHGYEGAAWYRRTIEAPESWQGRRIVMRFEGVNYHARVWVNGQEVGTNDDPFLPFELRLDPHLEFGRANSIAVRVDNVRRQGEVPGKERGWRPFGGILRDVSLIAINPLHLKCIQINAAADGQFMFGAEVGNEHPTSAPAEVLVRVASADGRELKTLPTQREDVSSSKTANLSCVHRFHGIDAWSPHRPTLYVAHVELRSGEEVIEHRSVRFGFRTIQVQDNRILLNGEPIYLIGFNRHEDSPRSDMVPDLEIARKDLRHMKELGCNFVRLCHYPHDPREIDLCDELGLLVMGEIPVYWWHGHAEGEQKHLEKLNAARRQLAAMIERDFNHPSVIFWSVSNETDEDRNEVAEGNAELVRLAKQLDPSRLATHVSMKWNSAPRFEADDVCCVNSYPTWYHHGMRKQFDFTPAQGGAEWRRQLANLHEAYPDKPIFVTEFGHPAIEGTFGSMAGEDFQAEVIREEYKAFDAPYVCGATIWCYADHPWPEENFIQYMTTSPFGVVTRDRRHKKAVGIVRELFHARHAIEPKARNRVTPAPDADIPVQMVRPHMRDVSQFQFPAGFGIRAMRRDEGAIWTDVQKDAERLMKIGDDLFTNEFGDDPDAIERRCFLILNEHGSAVGTISGWYSRDYRGQDHGRIHWFAIRPACQGKGLAKPAMTHAMNAMAQWHDRAWLATSTGRTGAIKIYLDFGFVPVIDGEYDRAVWQAFRQKLSHPLLSDL